VGFLLALAVAGALGHVLGVVPPLDRLQDLVDGALVVLELSDEGGVGDAVAANQTLARARKAAAVAPFSSGSGSV
jgi:hypothetical protein